ncbi:hypothetical protein HK104_000117 [Borealophlyctis nickersoniae]|nr:hypothetical protein HK104_000117 [Borealophlyctis nickersoniae]
MQQPNLPAADPRQLYASGPQPQIPPPAPEEKRIDWVPASDGNPPENAIVGGKEPDGRPLYIGRAPHANGIHPGKYAPHLKGLNYSYAGEEHTATHYEALVGPDTAVFWVPARADTLDSVVSGGFDPVVGGYEEREENKLYVARTEKDGAVVPGKTGKGLEGKMAYGWAGKEEYADSYEIMMERK